MFIQSESVRYATQVSHISSLYEPEVFYEDPEGPANDVMTLLFFDRDLAS